MDNSLLPEQIRTGHLIDGDEETPYQSCTLSYENSTGLLLSVPFVERAEQFASAQRWFEQRQPPESLLYCDNLGEVTFTGLRWRGHSGTPFSVGKLSADVVIFGRPRKLKSAYKFKEFFSNIDGLDDFASFRSIDSTVVATDSGHAVTVAVEATEEVACRHGGFTYTIRANAPWTATDGRSFTARSGALLETRAYRGASANDHLTAQWPIRALIILVNGKKTYWRSHRILDDQFPTWMLAGPPRKPTPLRIQLRRTDADTRQPEPKRGDFFMPMLQLCDLGSSGLRKWLSLYSDEAFRRAIEPAVEVINGASRFLEPQIMMTVLGLDAMGYYRDPQRARNTPLLKQIERCLSATRMDWSSIGSPKGIAKTIANINNDLKHPDRLNRPDPLELRLISNLAIVIMRLQLFDLLELPGSLRENFLTSSDVLNAVQAFKRNGVTVDDHGTFVRSPND